MDCIPNRNMYFGFSISIVGWTQCVQPRQVGTGIAFHAISFLDHVPASSAGIRSVVAYFTKAFVVFAFVDTQSIDQRVFGTSAADMFQETLLLLLLFTRFRAVAFLKGPPTHAAKSFRRRKAVAVIGIQAVASQSTSL
ncbi:expressed unknown protein [Seminavis robusta]|uniref:Uncharacterized protein n=1 Tax=Seminavis robusta TaxID=568900 RepID=A0A9N8E3G4_9STRA|nr:expressed unknown protein [Seminavis robusta]|eukprot:Sro506_g156331.1  (138) ;mRNA; r:34075-34488